MRKCEKYSTARQAIDDNKDHAHCMLYNKGYKQNSEYVILLFNGNVKRARLSVRLYVNWLSCFILNHVTCGN